MIKKKKFQSWIQTGQKTNSTSRSYHLRAVELNVGRLFFFFFLLFDHMIIYSTEVGTVVVSLTKIKMYFLSMKMFRTKFEHI